MSLVSPATALYIKEKWQHAGFQKYFQNMGWAFTSKITSLLLSFFIGALVARYLGPEKYGVLNYTLSFVTIFVFLSSFGIDNILVRDLVKNENQKNSILGTAFVLKVIGGALVILITVFFSLIIKNDAYTTVLIFIYSIHLLFASLSVIDSYFQSIVKYKYTFFAQFISIMTVSALKLYLIYLKAGTGWFILAIVLDTVISAGVLLIFFNKTQFRFKINFDKSVAKKLLVDSWPFILTGAFFLIYTKIDQVMIGKMLGTVPLGIYAAGVKLAEIWYFVPGIICGVLFPSIINAKMANTSLYKKRLKKILFFVILISFIFAFFEFILAKFLVLFIFGKSYLSSVIILKIYTWAGIMVSVITVLHQYLTIENRTKIIILSSLAGAIVNITLNLILIPEFGIQGAAWATLISYALIPITIWLNQKMKTRNE